MCLLCGEGRGVRDSVEHSELSKAQPPLSPSHGLVKKEGVIHVCILFRGKQDVGCPGLPMDRGSVPSTVHILVHLLGNLFGVPKVCDCDGYPGNERGRAGEDMTQTEQDQLHF